MGGPERIGDAEQVAAVLVREVPLANLGSFTVDSWRRLDIGEVAACELFLQFEFRGVTRHPLLTSFNDGHSVEYRALEGQLDSFGIPRAAGRAPRTPLALAACSAASCTE